MNSNIVELDYYRSTIPKVMSGIGNSAGKDFYQAITQQLATCIASDFTFISRLLPGETRVKTLALCAGGQLGDNMEYDLAYTPCQDVLDNSVCVYPRDICSLYPKDQLLIDMQIEGYIGTPLYNRSGKCLGLIVALYKTEIRHPDRVQGLFELFAGRIAAEIENHELNDALTRANDELRAHQTFLELRVQRRTAALEDAMAAAEEANRGKSEFLAQMSHEIRNPLNGVLGVADLLMDAGLTAEQQQLAQIITHSGQHLMGVINDILDWSKVEAGQLELEARPVDLRTLVHEVAALFQHRTGAIALHLDIDDAVPAWVEGDSTRMRQILVNLLSNAFKFTREGEVQVRLGWRQGLEVAIEDTGIGIAKDKLARLFHRYVQGDSSVNRKFGGTGLGLAICKGLAEAMGGRIEVRSTVGVGSCFTLWLPLADTQAPKQEIAPSEVLPDLSHLRVLVAEDDSVNQMVIKGLLARYQIRPEMVANGAQALNAVIKNVPFQVILMDCEMPVMDGLLAAKAIREHEQSHALEACTIFALTGHVLSEEIELCVAAGMNGHLAKPVEKQQLHKLLITCANKR
ncbi:ATP-binding protein [Simiduia sp. 21SJ11W-1]|uniref:hybrid sensor histidine kinase/response regulator n=1 Tax=Simiduia sp. 21SJ11W-1 TaxID=2909669 RepID=UPI00209F4179|nr:ATP-binding protein [Simiduia sp. 21SJ11W-1]UTA47136.1 ATP-binding protein [Simiduia sp. 21SJ11W-1]